MFKNNQPTININALVDILVKYEDRISELEKNIKKNEEKIDTINQNLFEVLKMVKKGK